MATYTDNYQLTLPTYAETADIATINNNMTKIDEIMHDSQISIATAYDASTTSANPYNTGDIVMYEKIAYKCKYDGVYGTWDASKWEQTTLADNLGGGDASEISYDNTTSGLTADDVQEAIDELEGNIEDVSDGLDDAVESLAPAYDSTQTYDEGDIVSYQNKLYECNTDNTTGTWNAQYWDEYIISENMGASVSITPETVEEPRQKIADFEIDGASGSLYAPIVEIEGHASGAIASFTDGGNNKPLKGLKVAISPIQEGSGTPSPQNKRPISGWTGANVTVCGKNLFNEKFSDYSASNAYLYYGRLSNNQALNISFEDKDTSIDISGISIGFAYNYTTGAVTNYRWSINNDVISSNLTNVTNRGDYGNTIIIYPKDETTFNKLNARYNIKITIGSDAESYTPYVGTTYSIPFKDSQGNPLTIYNGEIHIRRTNGVWTGEIVDKGYYIELGGNLDYQSYVYSGKNGIYVGNVLPVSMNRALGVANMSNKVGSGGNDGTIWAGVNSKNLYWLAILDILSMTLEQFKTWIDSNHLQLVIYSSTPINTYSINPPDIPNILTRLGYNNLWSDTGDIDEVVYIRDINLGFNALWDAVMNNNSGTRSFSSPNLSKSATKEETEETKEEPKEEEETKEEQR